MKTLLAFLIAVPLAASVLQVSNVSLAGSGTLTDPDFSSYGGDGLGGLGLTLSASGSNANGDTVSIQTQDIELYPAVDGADFQLRGLVFDATQFQCIAGLSVIYSLCHITIDGVTGYGSFSNLGGGVGLLDVYAIIGNPTGFNGPGGLIAEATITNTVMHVTNVTYGLGGAFCPICPGGNGTFVAQFSVVDPPTETPEPGTAQPLMLALVFWFWLRWRRR